MMLISRNSICLDWTGAVLGIDFYNPVLTLISRPFHENLGNVGDSEVISIRIERSFPYLPFLDIVLRQHTG